MVLPVFIYGHPVLKKVAHEIEQDYPELDKLIEDMFETMYKADGVGLAGPQVGKSLRIFVIDATAMADDEPELADFKKVFINPEILELDGEKWGFNEGCLSLPTIREEVDRPAIVRIRYQDKDFQMHEETYDGIAARIIQHEYDHLEGTLFIEKISPLRRRLLTGKLNAVKKGKVEIKYKTKLVK